MTLMTQHSAPVELSAEDRHTNIVTLQNALDILSLQLGEELYYFCEGEMWLERDCKSFEEYLASPEVNIKRTTAYALKRIYKILVLDLGVPPAGLPGWTKLDVICSHINEDNKDDLIADASTLTRNDLRKLMVERFGGKSEDVFMRGIQDITFIIYRIEHLASDGQYDRLLKIKKLLQEM